MTTGEGVSEDQQTVYVTEDGTIIGTADATNNPQQFTGNAGPQYILPNGQGNVLNVLNNITKCRHYMYIKYIHFHFMLIF